MTAANQRVSSCYGTTRARLRPMNESFAATFKRFPPAQRIALIIFLSALILPPFVVAVFHLPPASWLNSKQGEMLHGSYFPELTLALLILGNALLVSLLLFAAAFTVK